MPIKELWYDVVIVGGGGAALKAAVSTHNAGANTVIVTKGPAGRSGATYYSVAEVGAFNVPDGAKDPTDSPEIFYKDMEAASLGMAKLPLCKILAEKAEEAMKELDGIGGGRVFARENGKYKVYKACFSSKARSHVVENHFKPVAAALGAHTTRLGIPVMTGYQAADILTANGEAAGVMVVDKQGNMTAIHAKSVVLATGGASTLFERNMYPSDITGDGYAMAYRAGADIANMEFIQAGIGVAHPFINLFGNYLWEATPGIKNAGGKEVLGQYARAGVSISKILNDKTHFPFSTRDDSRYIEIAVQSEINKGNTTSNGNVYLDFLDSDIESVIKKNEIFASMWETTYRWHKAKGIDLLRQPVEIACFAHAINGGVLIDEKACSSVPGLYAAGETASGPHGADRLGGNMSVTCQVFGKIAGEQAAKRALSMKEFPDAAAGINGIRERLDSLVTDRSAEIPQKLALLQKQSDRSLLIVRSEDGLKWYLTKLSEIGSGIEQGGTKEELANLLELQNLLVTGRMIAGSALSRRESRGSHYREDFPEIDPKQNKMTILNIYATEEQ